LRGTIIEQPGVLTTCYLLLATCHSRLNMNYLSYSTYDLRPALVLALALIFLFSNGYSCQYWSGANTGTGSKTGTGTKNDANISKQLTNTNKNVINSSKNVIRTGEHVTNISKRV